jgi:hypothetical protein
LIDRIDQAGADVSSAPHDPLYAAIPLTVHRRAKPRAIA